MRSLAVHVAATSQKRVGVEALDERAAHAAGEVRRQRPKQAAQLTLVDGHAVTHLFVEVVSLGVCGIQVVTQSAGREPVA